MKNVLQINFQVTLTSKFLGLSIPSLEFSKLSCQKQVKWHLWSASKKEVHNPYTNASVVICELLISQWPLGHESFLGLIKSFQCDPPQGSLLPHKNHRLPHPLFLLSASGHGKQRFGCLANYLKTSLSVTNDSGGRYNEEQVTGWLSLLQADFSNADQGKGLLSLSGSEGKPFNVFKYWHHFSLKGHVFSTKHTYQTLPSFPSLFNSRVVYNVSGLQPDSGPL